jgi:hypothetical protein
MKNSSTARAWILGPHSPSMMVIKELLKECGEFTTRLRGRPKGTGIGLCFVDPVSGDSMEADEIYTIECTLLSDQENICFFKQILSKPDEPPENFMTASLVGQTISALANLEVLNIHDPALNVMAADLKSFAKPEVGKFFFDNMWRVFIGTVQGVGLSMVVPENLVYAAAAEHCLKEAYAGKCLGVPSGGFLINFRSRQKSTYYASLGQNRSAQSIENDIEAARLALVRHGVIHITSDHLVKDMRESSNLRELEEAALAYGYVYVAYEPEAPINPKTFNEGRREDMRKARAAVLKARHDLILKTRTGEDFCQKDSVEGAEASPDVPVAPLKSAEAPRRRILLGGRTTPGMLGAFVKGGFLDEASKDSPVPAKGPAAILTPIPPNSIWTIEASSKPENIDDSMNDHVDGDSMDDHINGVS